MIGQGLLPMDEIVTHRLPRRSCFQSLGQSEFADGRANDVFRLFFVFTFPEYLIVLTAG
jgi:hypothetical protein